MHIKFFLWPALERKGMQLRRRSWRPQLYLCGSFAFRQVWRKYGRIWTVIPFWWWTNAYLLINICSLSIKKTMPKFKGPSECYGFFWPRKFKRDFKGQHLYKQNSRHSEGTPNASYWEQVREQRRTKSGVNTNSFKYWKSCPGLYSFALGVLTEMHKWTLEGCRVSSNLGRNF